MIKKSNMGHRLKKWINDYHHELISPKKRKKSDGRHYLIDVGPTSIKPDPYEEKSPRVKRASLTPQTVSPNITKVSYSRFTLYVHHSPSSDTCPHSIRDRHLISYFSLSFISLKLHALSVV